MKIILLIPILFYVFLILVNPELIHTKQAINIFGATSAIIPFFLYNAIFIVFYAIVVFFAYDGLNVFLKYKIKKQDKEITELKSILYDGQKEILKKITKEIQLGHKETRKENKENLKHFISEANTKLNEYNKENNKILLQHGKETDRILSKVNLLDKGILEKIKTSIKG